MEIDDKKNWQDFRNGNKSAFDEIYQKYRGNLFNFCLYTCGNKQLSEEAVQESFFRLLNQKNNHIKSLKSWLFITCRNHLYNALNKENNYSDTDIFQADNSHHYNHADHETRDFIEKILFKLKANERELIILREFQQFSIRELSVMLKLSEEAIRVRLFRIRKKLFKLSEELK